MAAAALHILLVGTNPPLAGRLQALLAEVAEPRELSYAPALAEARQRLQGEAFDAALLPLSDSQGGESLASLAAEYPALPILVLAEREDETLAAQAFRQGAEDCLVLGTFNGRELLRAVRYAQARKQAENALRSSETKYRTLFRANCDAVATLTTEGRWLSGNPAIVTLLGLQDDRQLTSMTAGQVSPECQPDGTPSALKAAQMRALALEQGSHFFEWLFRRPNGTEFPGSVLATRIQVEGQTLLQATIRDITEQKQAAEAMRQEQRLLESIINSLPGVFYLLDEQGTFLRWNKNFEQVTGYSPAEMERLVAMELFTGAEHAFITAQFQTALREGAASGEAHLVCKDGRRIPYYFTGIRVLWEGKLCVLGTGMDISERKLGEETLRLTNAILQTQQETSPDGILVVNEDSQAILFNQRFLEMWGIAADYVRSHRDEQILQSVLSRLAHPEEFLTRVQYLYDHRQEQSHDEIALRDGRTFDRYSAPMFGPDGQYYGRIWYFRDISERKRAEAALRQEQEFSKRILESLPGIFYLYSYPENRMVFWNKQHETLLGFDAEELRGRPMTDWHVPEAREGVMKAVDEAMEKGFNSVEAYLVAKDGHRVPFLLSGVRFESQGRRFLMGIGVDITERKQVEEELRKYRDHLEELVQQRTAELVLARDQARAAETQAEAANHAKSVFLATMSHELRTPLNAVLGFSQLLRDDPLLNASQKESLDIINRSGAHLLGLINDILQMSRIEAGHLECDASDFDLWSTLDTVAEMMHSRSQAKGLQFCLERSPSLPQYVRTDERKLKQVLINLTGNAVKFTATGSVTLRARAEDQGRHLWFEVEDTGQGMEPQVRATLFEPFRQGGHRQEGAGLGLFISQKLVRLLGGEIVLHSQTGRGARFSFDIHCQTSLAAQPLPPAPRPVASLAPGQATPRILVAEDTPESRLLMVKWLQAAGFEVFQAENGCKAVQLFQELPLDLVLMDMRMPGMDGYEAIERIRALPQGKTTPIIAVTANAFEEERQNILALGTDGFLRKPVQCAEVLDKIRQLLGVSYTYVKSVEERQKPVDLADLETLVATLPADLIEQLTHLMTVLDLNAFKALLPQVARHAPELADTLLCMANDYHLSELAQLFPDIEGKRTSELEGAQRDL